MIELDAQLLSWSETSQGGSRIVLQLVDHDDLEHFKLMTIAKGRGKTAIAGQLLRLQVEQVDDDAPEPPEQHKPKGGPLSQLAGRWCEDEEFRMWLFDHYHDETKAALDAKAADSADGIAAVVVRGICGVGSRAQLDHEVEPRYRFNRLIREPYQRYLQGLQP